jgi:hypothetical protein
MSKIDESLTEMVERRNKRLLKLFTGYGYNVRLVGDEQKPAVVLDEMIVLSCFVKNFDLYFTREPFSDDIVKQIKLKHDTEISQLELQEAIELSTHRVVSKIQLTGTDLFLVGYNYLNSEDAIGRYPVFAKHKPKIYFDKDHAVNLVEGLKSDGYNLSIV